MVCLIDPVGGVYACPFAIHENFLAGNILSDGGFREIWQRSDLFTELREPQSAGACASAPTSTRAEVAAWPPSSSPACPRRS